jgi:predicted RecB family nuclease
MRRHTNRLTYSPSDLTKWMASPFSSWLTRFSKEHPSIAPKVDGADAQLELLAEQGDIHEAKHLEKLKDSGLSVVEVSRKHGFTAAHRHTIEAMKGGADVIFQGALGDEQFEGYTDFLVRVEGKSSLGAWHYEVHDTKLALRTKPYFLIQLAFYTEALSNIQERVASEVVVVTGQGDESRHDSAPVIACYKAVREMFLEQMENDFSSIDDAPEPTPGMEHRPYNDTANNYWLTTDHLCQVANISRRQIEHLRDAGITTMASLSNSPEQPIAGISEEIIGRLIQQAQLQIKSQGLERPLHKVLPHDPNGGYVGLAMLPPRSKFDVYFDIEGYPLAIGGLEYLFGATTLNDKTGEREFRAFWAHDDPQEKLAFEQFIDWIFERLAVAPNMHIYHYAPYEITAMRRLCLKYSTREDEVDHLLRNQVFVDLYKAVREGILLGEPKYSIKNLEHAYWRRRDGEINDGGASIVQYYAWLISDEPQDVEKSQKLKSIEIYNKDDCDSTLDLCEWLRTLASGAGIAHSPPFETEDVTSDREPRSHELLRAELLRSVQSSIDSGVSPAELAPDIFLAELLMYHAREDKVKWWNYFDKLSMTAMDAVSDINSLGCLVKSGTPSIEYYKNGNPKSAIQRYSIVEEQRTTLNTGANIMFLEHPEVTAKIDSINLTARYVDLKFSRRHVAEVADLPRTISLMAAPDHFRSQSIVDSIVRTIPRYLQDSLDSGGKRGELSAMRDLLSRAGYKLSETSIACDGMTASEQAIAIAPYLESTTICIQGPPGTGKTYTAARMILASIRTGKTVGVTSNSHKAIENLIVAVYEANEENADRIQLNSAHVSSDTDARLSGLTGANLIQSNNAKPSLESGVNLISGTAWLFSREELTNSIDQLYIDEASQVCVANVFAMASSTDSIVLLGDQRQLATPSAAAHPLGTGEAALPYLIGDEAVVPKHLGLFLGESWRMHPDICEVISKSYYDGRLKAAPITQTRTIRVPGSEATTIRSKAGVQWEPVTHSDNGISSSEESARVVELVVSLLKCDFDSQSEICIRSITEADILVMAPFNAQVQTLKRALNERYPDIRVGTVDKFQGQEAPVIIMSMTSSSLDDSPRGAGFLFDKRRLNVAISRAQCLSIVVGATGLLTPRFGTVEDVMLCGGFLRLIGHSL